jgi:hypothetical protein
VRIEDNEFDVVKRPKSLTFERLLEDPRRSHKLANQLLKDAVLEDTGPSMGNTVTLRAGRFTARFQSIVPESEFQVLMGRNEPQELDLESAENFSAYWRGLLENATENAQELPSYNTTLERFRPTIEGGLTPAFRKEMLFSGEVVVNEFQELQEERRGVAIALDDNRLQFNSPIPQNRWTDIIRAHQPAPIQSNVDLLNTGREAALRLVTDRNFRDRFDDVRTWFEKRKQQNPSVGHQAIVCGGQVLEDVHINNNNVAGFYEGIHVGVSHRTSRSDPHLMAGGIYICENRITLRTPMEEFEGQYGIFAGNSNRIALENNELINLPARSIQEYRAGILVWGYLGSFVVLRQNSTARCQTGIRVVAQGSTSKASQRLWRAVDNLTDSDSISLPSDFIERDNVTAKGINNTYHNQEEN